MCDEKCILYNQWWPAQLLNQEEAPEHFPKPNLHQKKGQGHCLVVCCGLIHYSFLNPGKSITSEKCAQQIDAPKTAPPVASIGQQKGPNSSPRQYPTTHHTTNASKVERIRLWRFASPAIFTWLLANWLPLLQASPQHLQGKSFHNHRRQNAFQVSVESWNVDFYTFPGINKHFSLAKMCWL